MDELVDEILKVYKGKLVRADINFIEKMVNLSTLLEIDETGLAKILRRSVGRRRRKRWSIFPDENEKEEIRSYLIKEIQKRPKISPILFNALFGIGFDIYFNSWNELKEKAGLSINEPSKLRYDLTEGRKLLFDYTINQIQSGHRATQKMVRQTFKVHISTYFVNTSYLKYKALEVVVYNLLKKDASISLNKLSERTGYTKKTIKNKLDMNQLRGYASLKMNQEVAIVGDKIKIMYA